MQTVKTRPPEGLSRPTQTQIEKAALRILAAVACADQECGYFSAYLPAPYGFVAQVTIDRLRDAANRALFQSPIPDATALRLLALAAREQRVELKCWAAMSPGEVAGEVTVSPRDLLMIVGVASWR